MTTRECPYCEIALEFAFGSVMDKTELWICSNCKFTKLKSNNVVGVELYSAGGKYFAPE